MLNLFPLKIILKFYKHKLKYLKYFLLTSIIDLNENISEQSIAFKHMEKTQSISLAKNCLRVFFTNYYSGFIFQK